MVFDNVFVPWEHVFIYRNIEISRDQWWKTTAHTLGNHQAQVRYVTKLRFLAGLAQRMNEMTGNVAAPPVQVMMGELAAFVTIYEAMLLAHEVASPIRNGVLWPSVTTLYSAMAMQSEFNGRMLEMVRELAGGAFITLPSSVADLESPETAPDMERYMRSASTGAKEQGRADAVALGFHRLGVRQPPPAVREILWRGVVSGEDQRLSQFRLEAGRRSGRCGAGAAAADGDGLRLNSPPSQAATQVPAFARQKKPQIQGVYETGSGACAPAGGRRWPLFNYSLRAGLLYTR